MPTWLSGGTKKIARCGLLVGLSVLACQEKAGAQRTPLTVYAASSLTEAFQGLERQFELANPEVDVRLSFGGSQTLRTQIEAGAQADAFASADEAHLRALRDAGLVVSYEPFAANELVLIVPPENPGEVTEFRDLSKPLRLVVGAPQVPLGRYTESLFDAAEPHGVKHFGTSGFSQAVRNNIVSQESNARLVRAKVTLGEADAAIVYRTDSMPPAAVRTIEIPRGLNQQARYFIAVLAEAPAQEHAARWTVFIRSAAGRRILTEYGFLMDGR